MELLYKDFSDYNQWSIVLVNLIIADNIIGELLLDFGTKFQR